MIVDLTPFLLRTKKTLAQAKKEALVSVGDQVRWTGLDQCSHCNIWYKDKELHADLDGSPICRFCSDNYGD